MTEKQYRLNKWSTRLLKNNRPLFDWFNDSDKIVDLLNELDEKWIDEFNLRETLQLELQRVEEENKTLKTRFKEERELAMKLGRECDTLTIKNQKLKLENIRLETIIRAGDDDYNRTS